MALEPIMVFLACVNGLVTGVIITGLRLLSRVSSNYLTNNEKGWSIYESHCVLFQARIDSWKRSPRIGVTISWTGPDDTFREVDYRHCV